MQAQETLLISNDYLQLLQLIYGRQTDATSAAKLLKSFEGLEGSFFG